MTRTFRSPTSRIIYGQSKTSYKPLNCSHTVSLVSQSWELWTMTTKYKHSLKGRERIRGDAEGMTRFRPRPEEHPRVPQFCPEGWQLLLGVPVLRGCSVSHSPFWDAFQNIWTWGLLRFQSYHLKHHTILFSAHQPLLKAFFPKSTTHTSHIFFRFFPTNKLELWDESWTEEEAMHMNEAFSEAKSCTLEQRLMYFLITRLGAVQKRGCLCLTSVSIAPGAKSRKQGAR